MIKLNNVVGHNDMCGGYSYSGKVSFEGTTVAEVLEEIKEFANNKQAHYIGDGFGNPESKICDAWGIRINDIPYVGDWAGWKNEYRGEYDEEKVIEVRVSGGWYCFYDFDITCEETKISKEQKAIQKALDDEAEKMDEEKIMKMFGL